MGALADAMKNFLDYLWRGLQGSYLQRLLLPRKRD